MLALLAKGIRIPEDLRMVGIDDVVYASMLPCGSPPFAQPCEEIGNTALRVMLERLAHPKMPARDVLLTANWWSASPAVAAAKRPREVCATFTVEGLWMSCGGPAKLPGESSEWASPSGVHKNISP